MLGSDILTKRDKALKPKSVLHASTLTTSPSLLWGFKWLYKQQVWFDRGQTTGDGSFATAAYSVVEVTQICCLPFSCLNHKKLLFPLRWPSSCACCPSRLVVFLSRQNQHKRHWLLSTPNICQVMRSMEFILKRIVNWNNVRS